MESERQQREQQQVDPLGKGERDGAERGRQEGDLGDGDLEADADGEGKEHRPVFEVVHAEDGAVDVAHTDGVEKLGGGERHEGVGLRVDEDAGVSSSARMPPKEMGASAKVSIRMGE